MTLVVEQEDVEQVVKQLNRLVEVLQVDDVTHDPTIEREVVLVKVAAGGNMQSIVSVALGYGATIADVGHGHDAARAERIAGEGRGLPRAALAIRNSRGHAHGTDRDGARTRDALARRSSCPISSRARPQPRVPSSGCRKPTASTVRTDIHARGDDMTQMYYDGDADLGALKDAGSPSSDSAARDTRTRSISATAASMCASACTRDRRARRRRRPRGCAC